MVVNMRICDLPESQVKIGLRVRSLARPINGTIIKIEMTRGMPYWWIQWDGENAIHSGFFSNNCRCDIID